MHDKKLVNKVKSLVNMYQTSKQSNISNQKLVKSVQIFG